MANQLKKLRKENNALDKQLSQENNLVITDMVCYLRSSDLCDYDIEIIRKELTGMALEAQLREEEFSNVVGYDYKSFCEELMKNGRQKTRYEKTLELLNILVYGLGALYIFEILFSSTIIRIFKSGQFTMPITYGFLVSTLVILSLAFGIYHYFTKYTFELSDRKAKMVFVAGFTVVWVSIVLIKIYLKDTVLLYVNCLLPLLFLAVVFTVIKLISDQYDNKLFETHTNLNQ